MGGGGGGVRRLRTAETAAASDKLLKASESVSQSGYGREGGCGRGRAGGLSGGRGQPDFRLNEAGRRGRDCKGLGIAISDLRALALAAKLNLYNHNPLTNYTLSRIMYKVRIELICDADSDGGDF